MQIDTIYLDMDGVISDFDASYKWLFGKCCRDDPVRRNWNTFVRDHQGFRDLPWVRDGKKLLQYIESLNKNIVILSCASKPITFDEVVEQKTYWLRSNGIQYPTIFTKTKEEKGEHASPSCLLIDDSIKCIDAFKKNGGQAILHQNFEQTKHLLEQLCAQ